MSSDENTATDTNPKFARKKLFIQSSLQLPIILSYVVIGILNIGIFTLASFLFSKAFFDQVATYGQSLQFDQKQELVSLWNTYLGIAIALAVLVSTLSVLYGLYFSHRISGPLYRISKDLDHMLETEAYFPIKLRKKDFFHQTTDKINELISRLRSSKKD